MTLYSATMKLLFLTALVLCASCAPPPRPYSNPTGVGPYENRSAPMENRSAPAPTENQPASGTTQQNAADCERQAALSASAGGRSEAFNNCMKARSHTSY